MSPFIFFSPCGDQLPTDVTTSGSAASTFSSFLPQGMFLSQIFRFLGRYHLDTESCINLEFQVIDLLTDGGTGASR